MYYIRLVLAFRLLQQALWLWCGSGAVSDFAIHCSVVIAEVGSLPAGLELHL